MGVILVCLATRVHSILEDGQERYLRRRQIDKGIYAIFDRIEHQQTAPSGPYIDRGGKPINRSSNEIKPWNVKLVEKLLLTMTVTNPKRFTPKGKPVTYTKAFVEFYNQKNHRQVHKIYGMIEFEKMCASTANNLRNFGAYLMIEICLIL